MIVRVLGEGQFNVPEDRLPELNALDAELVAAIDAGDDIAFKGALGALLDAVRTSGERMPDDYLGPSEFVLPGPDSTLDEVRALLSDEGLVPG